MVAERPTGADIGHPAHHNEGDEKFFHMVRRLPPEAREFVTSLSNDFMEDDEHQAFRSDPVRVAGLGRELRAMGLRGRQVRQVMGYFGFTLPVGPRSTG